MEDLSGKQLGAYRVVGPLGKGGMASVFKAYHAAMDRYVALKVLPRHLASEPEFVARFQQEARVVAKLQHPHILPVHDFGEAEGYTYLVMPFIQGGTLAALLKAGMLPLERIRPIIAQLGDALDYAHERGVIHRDVKPSNVLMDERGHCLLTDFGLAKILEGSDQLTASGAFVGTPAYMSPEQGLGKPADARSDLYALGVIFYEMVTGNTPFQAETPMAVVIKHINAPLPPPSTLNPNLPEAVERVILKAMAKEPTDRYATAAELVQAAQAAIASVTAVAASATTTVGRAVPPPNNTAETLVRPPSPPPPQSHVTPVPPVPPPPTPSAKTAAPAKFSFWRTLLVSGAWWGGSVALAYLLSFKNAYMAALIMGAALGWILASRWRKLNPNVNRGRRWSFVGVGALGGVLVVVFQNLFSFFVFPALGVAFGFLMRPLEPRLTKGKVALMGLFWAAAWAVGVLLLGISSRLEHPVAAIAVGLPGLLLGGGVSMALTLLLVRPRP